MPAHKLFIITVLGLCGYRPAPLLGQDAPKGDGTASSPTQQLIAALAVTSRHIPVGKPLWVDFMIFNVSAEPATLAVPGTSPESHDTSMGLPLTHVFSGRAYAGLSIEGQNNKRWEVAINYQPPGTAPVLELAPYSSVGITVEVTKYYPALLSAGRYRMRWEPYGGTLRSNDLIIDIAPRKQARILTDQGEMLVRLNYDDAPNHVDNFLELAQSGFYDNLTFHKIETGYFIQGGDPQGDGRGIRRDGKKLAAEFSSRAQDRGSVNMARLESDPNSASCQFFILNTRLPEWDGRYTQFGHLEGDASYATLDKLMAQPVDEQGRPAKRLYIRGIRIEDVPRDDLPSTAPGQSLPLAPLTGTTP